MLSFVVYVFHGVYCYFYFVFSRVKCDAIGTVILIISKSCILSLTDVHRNYIIL